MKRATCVLLLLVLSSQVSAQRAFYLGIKGGLSIPNITAGNGNTNPLSNGYRSRLGANISITGEFQINPWLSIQPELCYSEQGGRHEGIQAITNPYPDQISQPYLYADFRNEARLHYILLPVQARLNAGITDHIKLYIQGGLFAGALLSAQSVASGNSSIYMDLEKQKPVSPFPQSFDHTEDIQSSINPFNIGVIGAVGFFMEVWKGKIFIEGGGNYGFINIQKYAADGKNYAGAGTVQIGYAYRMY